MEALVAAEADIDHFQSRGRVMLVGDFNAWVGNPSSWHTPQHAARAAHAPQHGDSRKNTQGGLLLDMCARAGLSFLSAQALPALPTFFGSHAAAAAAAASTVAGHAASVNDLGHATMLDHVLTTDATDLPLAQTLQHTSLDVRACGTDHVPVLVTALPTRDPARPHRVRRVSWRRECLQRPEQAEKYRAHVQTCMQTHVGRDPDLSVQQHHDAVISGFVSASHATIGQRVTVARITVPWLTDPLTKQAMKDRCTAHVEMVMAEDHLARQQQRRAKGARDVTELVVVTAAWRAHEASLAFQVCKQRATVAVKSALRKWRATVAARLNYNVLKHPSSKDTYALLLRSSQSQKSSVGPEELRMPGTDAEYHDTLEGMLNCFARHYEGLGQPAPASTPHRHYRRDCQTAQWARAQAVMLDTLTATEPCTLDSPFTEEEIDRALRRMANNKAPGHDQLPAELLKYSGTAGCAAITALFNAILSSGQLPSQWRDGRIVNLHKTGARDDCGNYRGITLLPAIDKLFMAALASRLLAFVALHDQQYGFVRGKGTYDALFNLITTMDAHRDDPDMGPLYTFFLDIKKAFDTVNRDMLMLKLHAKGVTGKVWRVIRAAYRQTRSKVTMQGATSAQFDLLQGVAQGCPLSPVLFIIFLDDLLQALYAQCRGDGVLSGTELRDFIGSLYADDFFAPSTTELGLQRIVAAVQDHSEDWDWHAHFVKSKGMLQFAEEMCPPPQLMWGAHTLPVCTQEKVLGVHITPDGKWVKHLHAQLRAARFKMHQWHSVLSNPRYVLLVKLQVLRTYVLPCVQYAMEVITPRAPDELAIVTSVISASLTSGQRPVTKLA